MKIFLGVLSALSLLLAGERFYVSESAGHDFGAVFLLLVGIQLLVAAVLVHEVQQERTPKSPALTDRGNIPGLCPAPADYRMFLLLHGVTVATHYHL